VQGFETWPRLIVVIDVTGKRKSAPRCRGLKRHDQR
jgi:hypothetical protein